MDAGEALVVTKIDRIARSIIDFNSLIRIKSKSGLELFKKREISGMIVNDISKLTGVPLSTIYAVNHL